MNAVMISFRNLLLMTILLGGIYPMLILGVGQMLFPIRSMGSLVQEQGKVVGSELLAQNFTQDKYFWSRPQGPTQLSATSAKLHSQYEERLAKLGKDAPRNLIQASGSGIDPHISLNAAHFQKARVMQHRHISEENLDKLIREATDDRFLGFMGQQRVNVLKLNQLLDHQ